MARSRVSKSYNLKGLPKEIKIRAAEMLNKIADDFVKDMIQSAQRGIDVNNKPFARLSPNTIASKRLSGSPTAKNPLMDTGLLVNGIWVKKRATVGSARAIITVPGKKKRQQIGSIHNRGGFPHKIRGKGKKLAFVVAGGKGGAAGVRFANEVQHPGVPQRKFFYSATDPMPRMRPKIKERMALAGKKVTKSVHVGFR